MEFNKAEKIIEKYFNGESTVAEEKELSEYFASSDVADHLAQYKPLFANYAEEKEELFAHSIKRLKSKSKRNWLPIAASIMVLLGASVYFYSENNKQNEDLGTYNDPEVALKQTQKALAMLSSHINVGIESVLYINEYEESKNLIFK
jgi:hypothetical protein